MIAIIIIIIIIANTCIDLLHGSVSALLVDDLK